MIIIRENIFETNSSSTHSLVLNETRGAAYLYEIEKMPDLFKDGVMRFSSIGRINYGEINSFYGKVKYIIGCLAGGLIMEETDRIRKDGKHQNYWKNYNEISTDWLESNPVISEWLSDIVRLALAKFGIKFKKFDFRSYRNRSPDDMYEDYDLYCGGPKFKNGKKISNPLDHECMEWYEYGNPGTIFGKYSIEDVLTDQNISILYYRNG